jgi:hypothetical protein
MILCSTFSQSALAASGTVLETNIDAWDDATLQMQNEEDVRDTDVQYQSEDELFPDVVDNGEGTLEQSREERLAAYVYATIDGKLVVFTDVPRTAWFAPYVRDIAEQNIVSGYRSPEGVPTGLFGPQDNVTIEQMAKVMLYASSHDTDACSGSGTTLLNQTVGSGSWSVPFITCAEKLQWTIFSDGSVNVARPATRSEVIITLMQAFGITPSEPTGTAFTDVPLTMLFSSAIEQAKRDGIVSGYTDASGFPNGLFGPGDPVTRAEFAKIVTLGMQVYGE